MPANEIVEEPCLNLIHSAIDAWGFQPYPPAYCLPITIDASRDNPALRQRFRRHFTASLHVRPADFFCASQPRRTNLTLTAYQLPSGRGLHALEVHLSRHFSVS